MSVRSTRQQRQRQRQQQQQLGTIGMVTVATIVFQQLSPCTSVVAVSANSTCLNDAEKYHTDTGCSSSAPLCVASDGREPSRGQAGDHCAPCLAYTDHPAFPDWGCNTDEPLCILSGTKPVATTTLTTGTYEYPIRQHAGNGCAAYPCYNTKSFYNDQNKKKNRQRKDVLRMHIDEGCSQERPFCVDGMAQDPPLGQLGIQCVALEEAEDDDTRTGRVWGHHKPTFVARRRPNNNNNNNNNNMKVSTSFGRTSLCTGCPLSGQSRSCETNKVCDSLGGVIPSW